MLTGCWHDNVLLANEVSHINIIFIQNFVTRGIHYFYVKVSFTEADTEGEELCRLQYQTVFIWSSLPRVNKQTFSCMISTGGRFLPNVTQH